ncbi:CU044_2847 family protein [Streptomyces sp. NPDC058045]|uniref:CU044_2847 family protein n=1 Tax=Streptomyces sp. NPDC058045 TaxID=3346311 RepID=UPI0036E51B15
MGEGRGVMGELVAFPFGDGSAEVVVEVLDDDAGVTLAASGPDGVATAAQAFDAGFARVREAAARALAQLTTMPRQPAAVELEFGVKLSAQAGAVIAKTGMDGHIKIKMTWERDATAAAARAEDDEDEDDEE